ncbi:DUF7935 family protein [Chitinophaga nivalis]|uniref:Uncharacterized protein n=1 Tax=Chitinophaga nivalis TaxID=2991709 RepID=A0ABT3IPX1_9BACT|nr:hypothetical protein [Chitinophaga nivalis]MCW3464287.1 hypothetical protein [Chitinophaga nivalis]MCW3486022.1 hypothetical protein [Chitinophaga nivalis]
MNSQQLMFIAITIGAVALVYMTIKDLLKKNKPETPAEDEKTAPSHNAVILPLQLQAYERLALYVDRITPQSLISRLYQPGLTSVDMQISMVQSIKAEYEHNVTQQIYVSAMTWEAVKTLKEQTISVINQVAVQLPADAPAMDLNKNILEVFIQAGESPAELTAQIINSEAKRLMK